MLLAKEALMAPIDMHELRKRGPANRIEELRIELYEKVNALGIGAQGLGGLSTVLDVKILDYPTHAAQHAGRDDSQLRRHASRAFHARRLRRREARSARSFAMAGRALDAVADARRVNLDTLTREEVASWQPGDTLLLNGKLLTGRDAAHKRIADHHARGERLPEASTSRNRVIYYVGPVDPVRDEVVGPAGPDHRDAHGQVHRSSCSSSTGSSR